MLTTSRKIIVPSPVQPAPIHGIGIVKGNPKRCLVCRSEIQAGDKWVKYTAPSDPKFGTYSLIVHESCEAEK